MSMALQTNTAEKHYRLSRLNQTKLCDKNVNTAQFDGLAGPSLVFYPGPIEEWFSLSHDEISQSPPSSSCCLN